MLQAWVSLCAQQKFRCMDGSTLAFGGKVVKQQIPVPLHTTEQLVACRDCNYTVDIGACGD